MLGTHTFIGGLKSDKKEGSFVLNAAAASWDGGLMAVLLRLRGGH